MPHASHRGRRAAISALTASLLLGTGASAFAVQTGSPHWPSLPAGQTDPSSMTALPGAADFMGTLQVITSIFQGVRTQAPTIAAPIISAAVTAGTITQAQGTELTDLVSGTKGTGSSGSPSGFTPGADAGMAKVMGQIMQAVIAQLPTIAQPVLSSAVTAGTISQSEATEIESILTKLASAAGKLASSTSASGTSSNATNPLSGIQSLLSSHVLGSKTHKKSSHKTHHTSKHASHHRAS